MKRVTLDAEVVGRRLGGEMVLVHLGTGRMFSLNDTGARIWECLQEAPDLEAVTRVLGAEFEGPREELEADVAAFVDALAARRFLTLEEA